MNESLENSDSNKRPKFCVRRVDLESILERLNTFGFKVVADLYDLLGSGPEKENEIVRNFFKYYQILGKSQKLLDWAIDLEIERTDCPSALFRLESFTTSLLYHRFLSSQGIKFLKGTVCPLIERVCAAGVERRQLSTDVGFIFRQTELILVHLNSSRSLFPIELRLALYNLNKKIKKRFPATENAIPVLLFLRFICPSIIQPASFKIQPNSLSLDVMEVLLPVTRLLQCIANEQVENKILTGYDQEVNDFIRNHISDVQDFCKGLIANEEINAIKKTATRVKIKTNDKLEPLRRVVNSLQRSAFSYITFNNESWRKVPYLLKKRKLRTADGKEVIFLDILNSICANAIFLLPDLCNTLYYNRISQLQRINGELEKLKVKPILISRRDPGEISSWKSSLGFKVEIFIDPSGKSLQLFHLEPRRFHKSNLNLNSPGRVLTQCPHLEGSIKSITVDKLQNGQDNSVMKRSNSTIIKLSMFKTPCKSNSTEKLPPIKMFVLYGDYIVFDRDFEGEIQELLTLLHVCGSSTSTVKRVRKKLKPGIFRKFNVDKV